jgi:hypothetical protein
MLIDFNINNVLQNVNMKNKGILVFLAWAIISSCNSNGPSKNEVKRSIENMQESSEFLAVLPATFAGYVSTPGYDSVYLEFSLALNQDYNLNKEFYIGGKKDTTDYEKGKWQIEGEDILRITSADQLTGFEKFKIISNMQLLLADSLGNVVNDGLRHELIRKL